MGKIIRKTLPLEVSIGLLLLIFTLSFLLSGQVFVTNQPDKEKNVYFGMLLVSVAIIIMVVVLWEELLFPVKVKSGKDEMIFRNHRTKLKIQILIYCLIPIIFCFIYQQYAVNHVRFIIWAAIVTIVPVAGKLISGVNNYNDFLKLTHEAIAYKNNQKVGSFELIHIQHLVLVKDEGSVLHKLELLLTNGNLVTIDLDEMELEAFIDTIDNYIRIHYKRLLKNEKPSGS